MREAEYQARLIRKLYRLFPGCVVLKNDTDYQQGIPDLLVLLGRKWAMLEVKISRNAREQPNQAIWVDTLNQMSFAAFICPDNEEEVLDALQHALEPCGDTCLSERQ